MKAMPAPVFRAGAGIVLIFIASSAHGASGRQQIAAGYYDACKVQFSGRPSAKVAAYCSCAAKTFAAKAPLASESENAARWEAQLTGAYAAARAKCGNGP
jgi:hypothetical protein